MDMGTYGYSLGGTISTLLYLVVKVLIIVLAVVVVLGVIVWVRDNLFKNDSSKLVKDIKSDPLLKAVSVITLAVVGLVVLFALLNSIMTPGLSSNFNMGGVQGGMGFNSNMGGGQAGMSLGYNPTMSINGVLVMLVQVLMFILVISLVLAGFMYIKGLYESGKLNIFSNANTPTSSTIITDSNVNSATDSKKDNGAK